MKNIFYETIERTGPGLVTKTIYKYLCENKITEENENRNKNRKKNEISSEIELKNYFEKFDMKECNTINEDHHNKMSDITIFSYTVFHPLPNSISVDLNDKIKRQKLIEKYVLSESVLNNKNDDDEEDKDGSKVEMKINKYNSSYALHWWQKSWQEK